MKNAEVAGDNGASVSGKRRLSSSWHELRVRLRRMCVKDRSGNVVVLALLLESNHYEHRPSVGMG